MRRTLLLAAALVAIPLAAIAQEPRPPAAPTTPEQFVAQRQAKMARGGGALAAMKQAVDSGGELTALAPRIEWLTHWSQELPTMFPEGSDLAVSDARPEVWSDRAGFQQAAERFRTAVGALAAPAAAGDRPAFLAAWTAVRAGCGGCHDNYKN
jgi:cytochrome c556